jgi:hypothetical protein
MLGGQISQHDHEGSSTAAIHYIPADNLLFPSAQARFIAREDELTSQRQKDTFHTVLGHSETAVQQIPMNSHSTGTASCATANKFPTISFHHYRDHNSLPLAPILTTSIKFIHHFILFLSDAAPYYPPNYV